jgi:hypothetical protein
MNNRFSLKTSVLLILAGIIGFACLGVLFVFNPSEHGFFPQCVFHQMTGWNCPGCGALRATHQLLHGHVATAFRLNPLLVIAIPIVIIFVMRMAIRKWRSKSSACSIQPFWIWSSVAVFVLFGVARNLPFPPFAWMTQLPH